MTYRSPNVTAIPPQILSEKIKHEILDLYRKYPFLVPCDEYRKWEGVVYTRNSKRVHLLINTPNYPSLVGHSLFCSWNVNSTQDTLMQPGWKCDSLVNLLEDVILSLDSDDGIYISSCDTVNIDDLQSLVQIVSDVERLIGRQNVALMDENRSWIKLRYIDSSDHRSLITISLNKDYPHSMLRIIDADLPSDIISQFGIARRLGDVYTLFKDTVESLMPFWKMTEELAEEAWIIEPIEPTRKDLHRRIFLSDNLSVQLTFFPLKVDTMPDIKFLGSLGAVSHARDMYQRNLQESGWWSDVSVVVNLCRLLCLDSLPKKGDKEGSNSGCKSTENSEDNDCAICYETSVDDESFPAKWCSNKNCSGRFHHACLMEWLNSVPTSKTSFDHISGPCPHCDEKIFCPIKLK